MPIGRISVYFSSRSTTTMRQTMDKPNGELKIESGVPIPERAYRSKDAESMSGILRALAPEQSVVLPKSRNSASNLANSVLGKGNYICRKVDDTHTRVWRIK